MTLQQLQADYRALEERAAKLEALAVRQAKLCEAITDAMPLFREALQTMQANIAALAELDDADAWKRGGQD